MRTLTSLDATRSIEAYRFFDSLGRLTRSFLNEGGSPVKFITADTQYDVLGRAWRVSNPYRTNGSNDPINPSGNWTTTAYDALGRIKTVTSPDGAQVMTTYSGNQVTVQDQMGKARRSVTDALGRLQQVIEDPNGLAYQTNYSYDVLGNLHTVAQDMPPDAQHSQGVQQRRYFMYDSLSRLIRAKNPEQLANASLALTDSISGNSQWSVGYTYDNNNNLTTRTDARGITSTYTYDNLNRNTIVSYSGNIAINHFYDTAANGRGLLRASYGYVSTGANSLTAVDSYDEIGRPLNQRQQFYANNSWGNPFVTSRTYDLAGHVATQTYPSGRIVTYAYDAAGRTNSLTGNLGDGVTRTYADSITYDEWSGISRERFGTDTPLYHKERRNVRGQTYDMRLSTMNDVENWNRGAIVNYYSFQPYGFGTSGPDNNGNLLVQQYWIPNDDAISGASFMQQNYGYDSLNRIDWLGEYQNGATNTGSQTYSYDRYGNRTISNASGTGINGQQFVVDPNTNQLGVPSGMSGVMQYDFAGNLTNDSYSGAGTRTYDAENRMVTATNNANQQSIYTYDADGKRVRRNSYGQETWQVYGLDGELVAEYAANAAPTAPQKEYGYRNGELVVTAQSTTQTAAVNVASAAQGAIASSSSNYPYGTYNAAATINGDRRGLNWGAGGGWNDGTPDAYPDWLQVDFNGPKSITEVDVFTCQDNYANPSEPTETQTFSIYGLTGFEVQYWTGTTWTTVPGASVSGNNKVWRKFTFAAITTSKIRVLTSAGLASYSRLTEVEAYQSSQTSPNDVVQWIVSDQLGTPRMIADKTGSLAGIKRHDYLPFGEELFAGSGGRTSAQGYLGDSVRQKWVGYERDGETGLDYAQARYYASTQGRFTSPDPLLASGQPALPQSWNRYTYSINNPLANVDPSGLWWYTKNDGDGHPEWHDDDPGNGYTRFTQYSYYAGEDKGYVALDPYSKKYQLGFDSQEEAAGYSNQLAGETMLQRDPPQDISMLDGTLEMSTYVTGVTSLGRIGVGLAKCLLAKEGTAATAEAVTAATIHGAERIATREFTEAEIALTKTGVQLLQRDGATVFLKEVTPGKFNIIVEGGRGVVTAIKNVSEKSVARIASNYGWFSPIK